MNKQTDQNGRARASDKFILRLHDEGLRKHLKVRAAINERSLNAEILFLVKKGLAADGDVLERIGAER